MLQQILSDWKENLWLVVELTIVGCIIWFLAILLRQQYLDYRLPVGANIDGVYAAEIRVASPESSHFVPFPGDTTGTNNLADIQAILERIQELPQVEAAALGSWQALPYNYSYWGSMFTLENWPDTTYMFVNLKLVTSDFPRVLRLESVDGLNADSLSKKLEQGELLYGKSIQLEEMEKPFVNQDTLAGKVAGDPVQGMKIGAVIDNIRRSDYERSAGGCLIVNVPVGSPLRHQLDILSVRVKPGQEETFEKLMKSDPTLTTRRNISLSNLRPLSKDRRALQWSNEVEANRYIIGGTLLLFIVMIGLLGTFWSRVYSRTSDIALRKVFGASRWDIFSSLTGEALLLLVLAYIPASVLMWKASDWLSESLFAAVKRHGWETDMVYAGLISFIVMAVMIIIGVGIPAWRAMRIQPAKALKEE